MLRFSIRSLSIARTFIKQKPYLLILDGAIIQTNHNFFQMRCYSQRTTKQRDWSWKMKKLTILFLGITFTFIGTCVTYLAGAPEKDEDQDPIRDEFSDYSLLRAYFMRSSRKFNFYRKLITEKSRDKLLPDPLPHPYIQPKYTLVLELTDVLIHQDWTYNTGWHYNKRPLLDYFLDSLKDQYEIVIYTSEQGQIVFPLIDAIDRKNIIAYKLVNYATRFTGGHHVKVLNNLNRDLSKVICVDWNRDNVKYNKENLFCIKPWTGNIDDTSLLDLVSFLKAIADNDIEDVREVLKVYSIYEDPIVAFREKQKRLIDELEDQAAAEKEQEAATEKEQEQRGWAPSFFKKTIF